MAKTNLVDSGFLVALLSRDDQHHNWALVQAPRLSQPWITCEPVISESFHLVGQKGRNSMAELLRRGVLVMPFNLASDLNPVLDLMDKYADLPMSLADACLVRMTETMPDPMVVAIDTDFRVYRRHSRQVVPCLIP